MLNVVVQEAEAGVPLLLFYGFSRNLIRLENSVFHLSSSTSNSFGVHGIGGGVSYSLLSVFLLHSPVDTVIACRTFLLSELGFTDWAIFLAFCNNYVNWEISKFSRTTLYSLIMFVIHISTNVLSSQWS